MKNIQNLFLIFLFFFVTSEIFAGLGDTEIGAGGFKRNIEVNEIEEIDESEKQNEAFESDNKFKIIELKEIDANTVGTISKSEGGLGYDMWVGSEKNIIKNYLDNLPVNKESDLAIDLMKKLLLSNADVPESNNKTDLLLIRINKLIEIGDFDNAKSLIDLIKNMDNEEILIKQTEINLSLNNFDLACSDIEEKRKNYKSNFFWKKVEIFCLILNGENNKANLSLSLLKEEKNFNDENFLKIIDSLIYKEEINDESLNDLSLLNLSMTRVANINIKDNYILNEDPLFLSMIYRMPNVPIKIRIEAIEKSKKLLNLPIETIEEIYNSYDLKEKDKKISLEDNIILGYDTQAILFQMAVIEENNEKKAKIIKKSLELASINGNFPLISKLNLNTILEIKPSKKLSWFSDYAVKSLLISDKYDEAFDWYELIKKERDESVELFNKFIELWVIIELFNIKNTETNYKNISQTEIIKSINKFKSSNVDLEFNTLGFYILEIFSIKIIPDFWLLNLNKKESEIKRMPDTSLISLLKYSAENKRIGETILLILMSLDGKNFNQLHPFFLQIVISSLNQIGLEEKAFDLVTETLIER
tara:strand:+ start:1847 stop:3613 length:1767 start_codon:yes stop_codon:yes gene_type:complete